MRLFNVAVIFMFVVFAVSCENSVQKANDSIIVADEDASVNDENQLNDEIISGDEDVSNDETIQTDSDISSDEVVIPDEDSIEPNDNDGGTCFANGDCQKNYFCKKTSGMCEAEGICKEIPIDCDEMYAPVCGCDGSTSSNECEAEGTGYSVFYSTICLNEMDSADFSLTFSKLMLETQLTGTLSLKFNGQTADLLLPEEPVTQANGGSANVTAVINGINGLKVTFAFVFQRDPFHLPQEFQLTEAGGTHTAVVTTDSGTTVGFLVGTLNVTEYEVDVMGNLTKIDINASGLEFLK